MLVLVHLLSGVTFVYNTVTIIGITAKKCK